MSNASRGSSHEKCDFYDNTLPVKSSLILAFALVLLLNVVGNILIVITVRKRRELRKTVNYFIVNMAVSDLLYPLTDIPKNLAKIASSSNKWHIIGGKGLVFCKMTYYMGHVSISVSVASLIWIALDRFVAVVLPMKAHLISTKFRKYAIVSTWIVAMVINLTDLFKYELEYKDKKTVCKSMRNVPSLFIDKKTHIYLFHILPMIVLALLYSVIAVMLRVQDKMLGAAPENRSDYRKRHAFKMCLCILAVFYICSLPTLLRNISEEYDFHWPCYVKKPMLFIGEVMFYLSSSLNVVICFTFVESYRRGLRQIVTLWLNSCMCKRPRMRNKETDKKDGIILQSIKFKNADGS